MSLTSFQQLIIATDATKIWTSEMIMPGILFSDGIVPCSVALKPSSKESMSENHYSSSSTLLPLPLPLCQFVNSSEHINYPNVSSCFRFDPLKYHNNTKETRDALVCDFYESARNSGFRLDHKYRDNAKVLTFTCAHNRAPQKEKQWDQSTYQKPGTKVSVMKQVKTHCRKKKGTFANPSNAKLISGQNKHSVRRTSTNRPTSNDVRCPFRFQCVFDQSSSSWYLKHDRNLLTNPNLHMGHHKLRAHLIKSKLIEMSKSERELALQCSDLFVQNEVISKLMNARTKNTSRFCAKQVQYLRLKLRAHSMINDLNEGKSSAEALISNFQSMKDSGGDIHFIALTHSFKDGYLISNSRGRPRKKVHDDECKLIFGLNRSWNRF